MDEPTLPTAEELGVSDVEYARILRDLRQRGLGGEPVAFAAEMTTLRCTISGKGLSAALPDRCDSGVRRGFILRIVDRDERPVTRQPLRNGTAVTAATARNTKARTGSSRSCRCSTSTA